MHTQWWPYRFSLEGGGESITPRFTSHNHYFPLYFVVYQFWQSPASKSIPWILTHTASQPGAYSVPPRDQACGKPWQARALLKGLLSLPTQISDSLSLSKCLEMSQSLSCPHEGKEMMQPLLFTQGTEKLCVEDGPAWTKATRRVVEVTRPRAEKLLRPGSGRASPVESQSSESTKRFSRHTVGERDGHPSCADQL